MTKPVGIRIIAIGSFLGSAYGAIFGTGPALDFISQQLKTSYAGTSSRLAQRGAVALVLISFVFPILYALAGWGLWKLKNWARVLTIILTAIAGGFELFRWLLVSHFRVSEFIATVLSLALFAVIIFYLLRPRVVSVFSRGAVVAHYLDQLA